MFTAHIFQSCVQSTIRTEDYFNFFSSLSYKGRLKRLVENPQNVKKTTSDIALMSL